MQEERGEQFVATVMDSASQAAQSGVPALTGFLDQESQDAARQALASASDVRARFYGGYRGAQRKRLAVMPSGFPDETYDPEISFFYLRPLGEQWDDDAAVIAALRGLGVVRDEIGDIFRSDAGWQGVISSSAFRHPTAEARTRQHGDDLCELDIAEVSFPGQAAKAIRATVASMRLDAVAGAGFPASRTRLAQEIKAGRFKVNGIMADSPSSRVSPGDVVVCRGRGRLVVEEVPGETKRGRISVILKRYSVYTPNTREEAPHAHTT
ncbi:MAG: S4 domain-containing protein [Clostridia bacterium]|nr:S4 domain-containing protein [Clostridia bacterium]